jgi:hypothetical protein
VLPICDDLAPGVAWDGKRGQGVQVWQNGRLGLLPAQPRRLDPSSGATVAGAVGYARTFALPVTLAAIEARWFSRTSSAGRQRKAGRPTSNASSRSGATASSVPIRAQFGGAHRSSGSRDRAGRGGHHGTSSSVISGAAALAARTGACPRTGGPSTNDHPARKILVAPSASNGQACSGWLPIASSSASSRWASN